MSTLCWPHISINRTIRAVCTSWDVFFFFHSSPPLLVVGCELYAQPASYKGVIILYRLSRLLQTICMTHNICGMYTWNPFEDAHRWRKKKSPQTFRQESHWCISQCILSANNSFNHCLHHITIASCTSQSNVDMWSLRAFCNMPIMCKLHGDKSGLYAGYTSTSHCMAISWSCTLQATTRQPL